MNEIKYIEEQGQHYYQCVIEVNNMELVEYSFFYELWNFYNIVHIETSYPKSKIQQMKMYGTRTKHIFNYSMS